MSDLFPLTDFCVVKVPNPIDPKKPFYELVYLPVEKQRVHEHEDKIEVVMRVSVPDALLVLKAFYADYIEALETADAK